MKHCILVKFKPDFNFKNQVVNIKNIFNSIDLDETKKVEIIENCIDKDNRYDLLIRITMKKETLSLYDASSGHLKWKDEYGQFIDKKAIFDYE